MEATKVIDVSHHQGAIDWEQVKNAGIAGVIIRCGYGMDQASQDDREWKRNADACARLGIPFGAYLYSYADSIEKAASEAQHALRLLAGYRLSYPVYYDIEKAGTENGAAAGYEFGYTEDAHGGAQAVKITKTGAEAAGDGVVRQTISVEPNKRYQLSFWHKSDTLDSAAFTYEINQKDKEGNTISTHLAKLNDNLNMSQEYREFDYNFITSPYAVTAEIALHVVAGEGSLYLDDVAVKEVIPTEAIFVSAEKTELEVGETTAVTAEVLPGNATDLTFHWTSSDENVITISEDGTVTAVGQGRAYAQYVNSGDLTAEASVVITVK